MKLQPVKKIFTYNMYTNLNTNNQLKGGQNQYCYKYKGCV